MNIAHDSVFRLVLLLVLASSCLLQALSLLYEWHSIVLTLLILLQTIVIVVLTLIEKQYESL